MTVGIDPGRLWLLRNTLNLVRIEYRTFGMHHIREWSTNPLKLDITPPLRRILNYQSPYNPLESLQSVVLLLVLAVEAVGPLYWRYR